MDPPPPKWNLADTTDREPATLLPPNFSATSMGPRSTEIRGSSVTRRAEPPLIPFRQVGLIHDKRNSRHPPAHQLEGKMGKPKLNVSRWGVWLFGLHVDGGTLRFRAPSSCWTAKSLGSARSKSNLSPTIYCPSGLILRQRVRGTRVNIKDNHVSNHSSE